jgi:hypothetical protein
LTFNELIVINYALSYIFTNLLHYFQLLITLFSIEITINVIKNIIVSSYIKLSIFLIMILITHSISFHFDFKSNVNSIIFLYLIMRF